MHVRFECPACGRPGQLSLASSGDWQCPACDHRHSATTVDPGLATCPLCDNAQLYKKKDFPHGVGLAILTIACVASVFTYAWYEKWLTWLILIGSAAVDGLLYLWVGDAIVCYRCGAHYRGFEARDEHKPFELVVGERYRQERLRREQLK